MDPEYVRFKAVGQVWGELGRNLADSLIVPLDANEYAASLKKFIADMLAKYGEKLMQHDINIGSFYCSKLQTHEKFQHWLLSNQGQGHCRTFFSLYHNTNCQVL